MTKTLPKKRCVLFVDTGDNCRCPMARGYLYKLLSQHNIDYITIKTCGVMTPTGLLPTPETVQLLLEEGIDIGLHRSKPMTQQLLEEADLILGMTPFHVQTAVRKVESCKDKTFLLKEFVGYNGKDIHIHDPMGGTMEVYRKAFDELRESLIKLICHTAITSPPESQVAQQKDFTSIALNAAAQKIEEEKKIQLAEEEKERLRTKAIQDAILNSPTADNNSDDDDSEPLVYRRAESLDNSAEAPKPGRKKKDTSEAIEGSKLEITTKVTTRRIKKNPVSETPVKATVNKKTK